MRRSQLASVALLALVVFSACRDPTQIKLEITTDAPCPIGDTNIRVGRLRQLQAPVADIVALQRCSTPQTEHGNWVGSLVAVPSGDDGADVGFQVTSALSGTTLETCFASAAFDDAGMLNPGCIVARRALRYIPHTPLTLPVVMRQSCAGVACPSDQTCIQGTCVDATVDPELCRGERGCGEEALLAGGGGAGGRGGAGGSGGAGGTSPEGWAHPLSGANVTLGGLAQNDFGDVFVAGTFQSALTVDGTTITSAALGIFVARFDPAGNLSWLLGGEATEGAVTDLVALGSHLYLAGYFTGQVQLGADAFQDDPNSFTALVLEVGASGLGATPVVRTTAPEIDAVKIAPTSATFHTAITYTGQLGAGGSPFSDPGISLFEGMGTSPNLVDQSDGANSVELGMALAAGKSGEVFLVGDTTGASLTVAGSTVTNGGTGFEVFLASFENSATKQLVYQGAGSESNRRAVDVVYALDRPCFAFNASQPSTTTNLLGASTHTADGVDGIVSCAAPAMQTSPHSFVVHGNGTQRLDGLAAHAGSARVLAVGASDGADLLVDGVSQTVAGRRVFVVALDVSPQSSVSWVDATTTYTGAIQRLEVAAEASDDTILIAGQFENTVTPAGLTTLDATNSQGSDVFVARWAHVPP